MLSSVESRNCLFFILLTTICNINGFCQIKCIGPTYNYPFLVVVIIHISIYHASFPLTKQLLTWFHLRPVFAYYPLVFVLHVGEGEEQTRHFSPPAAIEVDQGVLHHLHLNTITGNNVNTTCIGIIGSRTRRHNLTMSSIQACKRIDTSCLGNSIF